MRQVRPLSQLLCSCMHQRDETVRMNHPLKVLYKTTALHVTFFDVLWWWWLVSLTPVSHVANVVNASFMSHKDATRGKFWFFVCILFPSQRQVKKIIIFAKEKMPVLCKQYEETSAGVSMCQISLFTQFKNWRVLYHVALCFKAASVAHCANGNGIFL